SGGDPRGNGQNPNTFLGKILRIDVSGSASYTIPADNPFVNGGGLPEVWAYGLRNPWRFSFDAATGDLYIADVGQNIWEEIDFQAAGSPGGVNYGWNIREGAHPYADKSSDGAVLVDPVFEYKHGKDCSITGGYVYRGSQLPDFAGIYIFGDFCSGTVWGLLNTDGGWQAKELFQTGSSISSFGVDSSGEMYLLDLNGGRLLHLERIP
ncbi:MAG: PQQ-dependent sugar dehydrogenase, partial [Anaerolineaceae bacterium]|nr:PQQ-dependent sugar dehydrogenase [Anaerolineaceae bacterium]